MYTYEYTLINLNNTVNIVKTCQYMNNFINAEWKFGLQWEFEIIYFYALSFYQIFKALYKTRFLSNLLENLNFCIYWRVKP